MLPRTGLYQQPADALGDVVVDLAVLPEPEQPALAGAGAGVVQLDRHNDKVEVLKLVELQKLLDEPGGGEVEHVQVDHENQQLVDELVADDLVQQLGDGNEVRQLNGLGGVDGQNDVVVYQLLKRDDLDFGPDVVLLGDFTLDELDIVTNNRCEFHCIFDNRQQATGNSCNSDNDKTTRQEKKITATI